MESTTQPTTPSPSRLAGRVIIHGFLESNLGREPRGEALKSRVVRYLADAHGIYGGDPMALDALVDAIELASREDASLDRDPMVLTEDLQAFLASPTSMRVDLTMGERVLRWYRTTRGIQNPAPDVVDILAREALETIEEAHRAQATAEGRDRLEAQHDPSPAELTRQAHQTRFQDQAAERERIRAEVRAELEEERRAIRKRGLVGVLLGGPLDGRALRVPTPAPPELVLNAQANSPTTFRAIDLLEEPDVLGEAFPVVRYRLLALSGLTTSIRTYIIEP